MISEKPSRSRQSFLTEFGGEAFSEKRINRPASAINGRIASMSMTP
jgi:hypothetical protein